MVRENSVDKLMTTQDKHIQQFFKAFDRFRESLEPSWLAEMQKNREWLEKDIKKRELEKSESLQRTLF